MARLGLYPALIVLILGVIAPSSFSDLAAYRGFAPLPLWPSFSELADGAVKAEYPWVRRTDSSETSPSRLGARLLVGSCCCRLQRGRLDRQNDLIFRRGLSSSFECGLSWPGVKRWDLILAHSRVEVWRWKQTLHFPRLYSAIRRAPQSIRLVRRTRPARRRACVCRKGNPTIGEQPPR